jgi:pimeloyl-ACP methyl ester carboxylesterase
MDNRERVSAPAEPAVIVGGFMSAPINYIQWQQRLSGTGQKVRAFVANVERQFWLASAHRHGDYSLQMKLLDRAVESARHATGAEKVWLVCHSAGGLVARLWLGDLPYKRLTYNGHRYVRGIIFLGAPYKHYEAGGQRSAEFAAQAYPGAYYANEGIKYISLIGKSVRGKPHGTFAEQFAYNSYAKVSPENPAQWGDGIVTVQSAYMPGAYNGVLPGVYHIGLPGQLSYGSPDVLPLWKQFIVGG